MTDRLARASLTALRDYHAATAAEAEAESRLKAGLSPEVQKLVDELTEARTLLMEANADLFLAELVRHFPGLAPALSLTWEHVSTAYFDAVGRCCTPEAEADDDAS